MEAYDDRDKLNESLAKEVFKGGKFNASEMVAMKDEMYDSAKKDEQALMLNTALSALEAFIGVKSAGGFLSAEEGAKEAWKSKTFGEKIKHTFSPKVDDAGKELTDADIATKSTDPKYTGKGQKKARKKLKEQGFDLGGPGSGQFGTSAETHKFIKHQQSMGQLPYDRTGAKFFSGVGTAIKAPFQTGLDATGKKTYPFMDTDAYALGKHFTMMPQIRQQISSWADYFGWEEGTNL
jgi:hypothetical protein